MASKLRAGSGFPYILKEDRGEVTEPQFMLRVLSADDSDRLTDMRHEYVERANDDKRRRELRNDMVAFCVVKCNVSDEPLTSILTDLECWELITGAILGSSMSADERKKFVLPLRSETDSSAVGVEVSA